MSLFEPAAWTSRIFIDDWRPGSGGDYPVIEPATGEELGRLGQATPDDVRTAAARAAGAQRDWARTPYQVRAGIMRRAGDLWKEHAADVQRWLIREAGSIPPKTELETWFAANACYEAAGLVSLPYGELLQTMEPHLSMTRRMPVGVVGVISPFNVPLILSIRAVAPALALGNAVILKPDPRTAVSGGVTLARVFQEAGLPDGVFSLLPGGADVGEALVTDPDVRMISFTGSTRAGRIVGALAGRHLKRSHLELGGNSALIVLDDVDVDKAVSVGAWGSYLHQGQICMATSRHLVQKGIAEEYVAKLAQHADQLPVGDPNKDQVALGPIIDAKQRDHIHQLVTSSVAAGARLASGGTYSGLFYRPTVLADVPLTAPAYTEEIFGPVAPVVAFDTIDDAVRLAADTTYGLALGILTRDVMKGLAIADRIPSGNVHINDQTVADEVVNPFGGVRDSGPGARVGGAQANLEAFTDVQWITMRGELPAYPF
ncbi:MAG: aldehyde dehydrogenase family protein [Chloroflexota bacterium]|nr:MAG: aldehyde dehydrogenase family protein [Chloroflexota bacterium]